jgi:gluconate 5-dehydrogenase
MLTSREFLLAYVIANIYVKPSRFFCVSPKVFGSPAMSGLFDLSGKRALVTGSGQGIGFAIAEGLAAQGASIVLNGRSAGPVEEAAKQLRAAGMDAAVALFDVTDQNAVAKGVDGIEAELGPIDILVNNAGMQFRTALEDFPADKWQQLLQTNISSVFFTGQAVARHMIKRGRGKIINIASVQSELARPNIAPYTATKGAV